MLPPLHGGDVDDEDDDDSDEDENENKNEAGQSLLLLPKCKGASSNDVARSSTRAVGLTPPRGDGSGGDGDEAVTIILVVVVPVHTKGTERSLLCTEREKFVSFFSFLTLFSKKKASRIILNATQK